MKSFFSNQLVQLVLIGIASLVIAFTYVHGHAQNAIGSPRVWSGDTPTYTTAIETLKSFLGGEAVSLDTITATRLLTAPLMLLASYGVGSLIGDYASGMLFVNVALYLISIPVFYEIVRLVYRDKKVAFIASVLYITNWCLFSFGTTYLSDMGGWFFFLLTTLFGLRYYRDTEVKKWLIYGVLSAIVGVFFKEYGGLGIMSLVLLIGISNLPMRRKVEEVVIAGGAFGLALIAYHTWFYLQFAYSYFDWYGYNQGAYAGENPTSSDMNNLVTLVKVVALIFLAGWPLFLIGLWHEWRAFTQGTRERAYILLALLPASLMFLAWPAFTQRVAFIFIPWVAMVAAFGLTRIPQQKIALLLMVSYIVMNYHVDILMLVINMPF